MKKNKDYNEGITGSPGENDNVAAIPEIKVTKGARALRKAVNDKIKELGWLLTDAAEYDQAKSAYESLSTETHLKAKIIGLTRILIEKKQFDDARELLERGIKQFPGSYCLMNNYGLLYNRSGNSYDALGYFDQAIKCEGKGADTSALYNKGLALIELNYFEEAAKIFAELIQIDDEDGDFIYQLGYCQLNRDNYWEAVQLFRRADGLGFKSSGIQPGCAALISEQAFCLKHGVLQKAVCDSIPIAKPCMRIWLKSISTLAILKRLKTCSERV